MSSLTPALLKRRRTSPSFNTYGTIPQVQRSNFERVQFDAVSSQVNEDMNFQDGNVMSEFGKLSYYLPCSAWIGSYNWSKFSNDFIAGVSLASFQIPLSISYATSLAHTGPLSGLYSLAITPFVYALFGSTPTMIVGPEAAISLVIGQNVETLMAHREDLTSIQIITVTTFLAGFILLIVGVLRLGFLGVILSRALLKGFIGSVGFIMILNSLITELKLNKILRDLPEHYHTPFEKILFLIKYGSSSFHKPTIIFSSTVFTSLLVIRYLKKRLSKNYKQIVFLPEILLVIVVVTFITYYYDFKTKYGISIAGEFNTEEHNSLNNPLSKNLRQIIPSMAQLSIITATLGFFESVTASKSLGGIDNSVVSPNREVIALGLLNIVGSTLGILPSFGGYGRSKINLKCGAQTVMSGVCMGCITLIIAEYFLPLIHFIPNCVLSVITTLIGLTLLEDIPKDILFYVHCRGISELFVFLLTVVTTLFHSMELGICVGCIYSVISIIKHSAKSRIQILAKTKDANRFVNVNDYMDFNGEVSNLDIEYVEGCLLIRIPEPLTFTNTEDMKERLDRVKRFGSTMAHPGSRKIARKQIEYIIFDLEGMTHLDSSGAQIFYEIINTYVEEGCFIFFARVPEKQEIRKRLRDAGVIELQQLSLRESTNPVCHKIVSDPYIFKRFEDALIAVDCLRHDPGKCRNMDDTVSIMSTTLVNSSLV